MSGVACGKQENPIAPWEFVKAEAHAKKSGCEFECELFLPTKPRRSGPDSGIDQSHAHGYAGMNAAPAQPAMIRTERAAWARSSSAQELARLNLQVKTFQCLCLKRASR